MKVQKVVNLYLLNKDLSINKKWNISGNELYNDKHKLIVRSVKDSNFEIITNVICEDPKQINELKAFQPVKVEILINGSTINYMGFIAQVDKDIKKEETQLFTVKINGFKAMLSKFTTNWIEKDNNFYNYIYDLFTYRVKSEIYFLDIGYIDESLKNEKFEFEAFRTNTVFETLDILANKLGCWWDIEDNKFIFQKYQTTITKHLQDPNMIDLKINNDFASIYTRVQNYTNEQSVGNVAITDTITYGLKSYTLSYKIEKILSIVDIFGNKYSFADTTSGSKTADFTYSLGSNELKCEKPDIAKQGLKLTITYNGFVQEDIAVVDTIASNYFDYSGTSGEFTNVYDNNGARTLQDKFNELLAVVKNNAKPHSVIEFSLFDNNPYALNKYYNLKFDYLGINDNFFATEITTIYFATNIRYDFKFEYAPLQYLREIYLKKRREGSENVDDFKNFNVDFANSIKFYVKDIQIGTSNSFAQYYTDSLYYTNNAYFYDFIGGAFRPFWTNTFIATSETNIKKYIDYYLSNKQISYTPTIVENTKKIGVVVDNKQVVATADTIFYGLNYRLDLNNGNLSLYKISDSSKFDTINGIKTSSSGGKDYLGLQNSIRIYEDITDLYLLIRFNNGNKIIKYSNFVKKYETAIADGLPVGFTKGGNYIAYTLNGSYASGGKTYSDKYVEFGTNASSYIESYTLLATDLSIAQASNNQSLDCFENNGEIWVSKQVQESISDPILNITLPVADLKNQIKNANILNDWTPIIKVNSYNSNNNGWFYKKNGFGTTLSNIHMITNSGQQIELGGSGVSQIVPLIYNWAEKWIIVNESNTNKVYSFATILQDITSQVDLTGLTLSNTISGIFNSQELGITLVKKNGQWRKAVFESTIIPSSNINMDDITPKYISAEINGVSTLFQINSIIRSGSFVFVKANVSGLKGLITKFELLNKYGNVLCTRNYGYNVITGINLLVSWQFGLDWEYNRYVDYEPIGKSQVGHSIFETDIFSTLEHGFMGASTSNDYGLVPSNSLIPSINLVPSSDISKIASVNIKVNGKNIKIEITPHQATTLNEILMKVDIPLIPLLYLRNLNIEFQPNEAYTIEFNWDTI